MAVSYQLRAQYVGNYGGGVISYGPYGTSFDIGGALTAGGGTITTNDQALVEQLDRYPPLFRSAFTGDPSPTIAPRFRAVSVGNTAVGSDVVFEAHLPGESYARWQLLGDGTISQGPGTSSPTPSAVNPQGGDLSAALVTAGILGGTVIVDRTYTLTSALAIPDNVTLAIQPAGVLDFSGAATGLTCITASGTVGSTVAVNTVAEAATTITGSAGIESGLAAGDWIRLSSDDRFDPLRTNSPIGEIVQVLSTASGSITVRSPVRDTYTTTPLIAKLTTRSGVSITGSGRIIAPTQGIAVKFDCACTAPSPGRACASRAAAARPPSSSSTASAAPPRATTPRASTTRSAATAPRSCPARATAPSRTPGSVIAGTPPPPPRRAGGPASPVTTGSRTPTRGTRPATASTRTPRPTGCTSATATPTTRACRRSTSSARTRRWSAAP
jgi:hypothetical protein